MPTIWRFHLAVSALLTVAGLWLYWPTLDYPFIFDDRRNITEAEHIRITEPTPSQLWHAGRSGHLPSRPVAKMTFALNYWQHGAYRPATFRLTNILIHICCALAVYSFVWQLLSLQGEGTAKRRLPWRAQVAAGTAILWLVHPVHIQSVTYIVQRMNSLAVMLCMVSICAYLGGRRSRRRRRRVTGFAVCGISGVLAFGCKENALMLPFLIFLIEWMFFRDLSWPWLRRQLCYWIGPAAALAIVALALKGFNPERFIRSTYALYDFTPEQRLLTQPRVIFLYLGLLLLPLPQWLTLEHDTQISTSLLAPPTTLAAIICLLVAVGGSIALARRQRLLSFCLLWFFINLAMESSIIGLEMVYEYRLYMPCITLLLLVVYAGVRVRPAPPAARAGGVAVVALALALATRAANRPWRSETALWEDCVIKAPSKARPHYNLGTYYADGGETSLAIEHFEAALRIEPQYALAEYNLAFVLDQQNEKEQAEQHYRRAIQINSGYAKARIGLGVLLRDRRDYQGALEQFQAVLGAAPNHAQALRQAAYVYTLLNDYPAAATMYERCLASAPDDYVQRRSLALVYERLGRPDDAVRELERVIAEHPDDAEARYSLGFTLERHHRIDEAIAAYAELVRRVPSHANGNQRLQALRQHAAPAPQKKD